ncbi:aminodeoxychorismate lyase [Pseudomonas sp. RL_15y_Pfl2_60]|uniref:aminodeoxychorismate lyase n=1 Tax=Pseudomonas sp. RL_15y_Pfl2_60 TaxID=3088709 RepID=UPI0030DD9477
MLSWVDGHPEALLSIKDRGLAYGDGLFETIAVTAGTPVLLERHLSRLAQGCARLKIALDQRLLRNELQAFCAVLGNGIAKLIITRGDGLRGYAPPVAAQSRRILLGSPPASYAPENAQEGVRLFACKTTLAEQPLLAGLKHLNRLEQVLARAEWDDPAYAEGLMCDVGGRIIEGVYSNIFMVRDGQLFTPDLSRCGVAGVMRAELLDQAGQLSIPCAVTDINLNELRSADEVFVCNSVYGVWPVLELLDSRWLAGPMTRRLQAIARDLLDS